MMAPLVEIPPFLSWHGDKVARPLNFIDIKFYAFHVRRRHPGGEPGNEG